MQACKLLVVEDDDSIRRLLVEYLSQRSGARVEAARDGVEALHQIMTTRYDVVVLDVMMPKMSGIDLLDSLTAMTSDPSVHGLEAMPAVIIVTAAAESVLPSSVLEQRFPTLVKRIFRKPFDVFDLASAVEEVIGES
jgi:CheY-like chemotaxis protein